MREIASESETKLRGGYYTPPPIARFLARWVLEAGPRRLLEPGCGDGAFLDALGEEGARGVESVLGVELHPAEAEKALRRARARLGRAARVICGDFLEWVLSPEARGSSFDGILGNPPYVRYQYLSAEAQLRAARVFAEQGLSFTGHVNAWVPFVVASLARLAPGGRLGMVIPSELLHVLHAQPLRDYLVSSCDRVLLLDPEELCFDGALQGVVLLMAEKARAPRGAGRVAIVPIRSLAIPSASPSQLFDGARYAAPGSGKWMRLLLSGAERTLIDALSVNPAFERFGRMARVDVGIVTGANKFFLVDEETVERHGLHPWVHPMFGRSEHVRGVIYDARCHAENRRRGVPAHFVRFGKTPVESLPERARRYVEAGEAEGLHVRYKCRIRDPWYDVPSVSAAPVGMLKRAHDHPRLLLNQAGAYSTDTAYRVWPKPEIDPARLVFGFVNSVTMLSAELEGRHYGGGVLELVPSEIERLLLPVPGSRRPALRRLDGRFKTGVAAGEILEEQDAVVLERSGLSVAERDRARGAWDRLRRRRQREPG